MPMPNAMGMQDDDQMGGSPPTEQMGGNAGGDDEATSVFLPKSAFGARPPKVGDSLKDFKVVDIDPETGEVEAQCNYDDEGDSDKPGYEKAFDSAMPEEG